MNQSLRSRLLLMAILPALLAALVVGGYSLFRHLTDQHSAFTQRLELVTDTLAAQLDALPAEAVKQQQQLLQALLEQPDVRAVSLTLADGQQLHAGPRLRPRPDGIKQAEHSPLKTDSSWQLHRQIHDASLTVEFSRQGQYVATLESLITLVLVMLAVMVLAMIPALRFSAELTSPIEAMIRAVRRVRDGELNFALQTKAKGELKELEVALRQMASALSDAQTELQQNVDQATQDLRETLETIEIQNIELDMARKEALKASQIKSEFLANMSHEIRTPLNGILGFTKLLDKSPLSPRQKDYLHTIHKSADSLLAIINDILDFSKIEAGKLSLDHTPLNLHDLIEDVQTLLAPMAQERSLEQAAIIYSDVPVNLLGDALRIRQVLTNLMSNAIKFTDHGSVVVRAMLEENRGAEAIIKITVTDTGNGLSPEVQKSLFQAFTQADQSARRQEGGTGLGLAISKRLVEGMGGEIGIESSEGQGSTFWFTLRAERDPKRRPNTQAQFLQGRTVTLVETDEYGRLGLYHMLSHWQMTITEYPTLDLLADALHQGELQHSDYLVVGLPSRPGQDLQPLIEELAALGLPMLALSNSPETVSRWLEPHANCQVQGKPATRERLLKALLALSQEPAQPASLSQPQEQLAYPASVMVVDDHPGNLKLARVFLEELGARVTACDSGHQALDAFTRQHFDLIFMDIQMPGMDGKSTTAKMRELEKPDQHTPIIALTAHALESERRELLDSGLDDYLSKPITETQLHHTLEKWVLNQPARTEPAEPEQRPAPANDAVFDGELARKRAGGRQGLADEMLRMLLDNLASDRPAISTAFDSGDHGSLLEHVHKLHGATRYCGTPRLEQAAKQLEEALKTGHNHQQLDALVSALCDEICAVEHYCQEQENEVTG